jgi:predicted nucleic acid-binding protein
MIILDTNVISEMMKPSPSHHVVKWFDQQDSTQLFITTITIAEISYGLSVLPKGNRRVVLEDAFNKAIVEAFEHRLLAFDAAPAYRYGAVMGQRKELGRPLSILDGQIASIALTHGSMLATRNVKDFLDCGLDLINPFE